MQEKQRELLAQAAALAAEQCMVQEAHSKLQLLLRQKKPEE